MAKQPVNIVPKEALAWLNSKGLKPGFDYRDVWQAELSAAFTVAKMLNLDLLSDVKTLVSTALEAGQTFEQFRDALKPQLVNAGWWGVQLMDDPLTGETKPVQLGSEERIKTIYRTNMRTARAAGQWDRIDRTKRVMPYLIYQLGPAREHRAQHVSWNGICLPVDDDFWKTHFTPNGWGCHCWIRQVSNVEYTQLVDAGSVTTTAPEIKYKKWVNKRTGEEQDVPVGIDPGWDYNPGKYRQQNLDLQLAKKQAQFDKL